MKEEFESSKLKPESSGGQPSTFNSAGVPCRVLILEDNALDADLMVAELRRSRFVPESKRVETKSEYLAALTSSAPALPCDIILADYSLPQFDGLQALGLLKEQGLDIPFIIVTGALGDEKAAECIRAGAADYLLKDRLARLGPAVRRALREKEERRRLAVAEAAPRESHAELEARATQRTMELTRSNELLREEIAERTRVAAVLRESEERYRILAEAAPESIFMIGPDGRVQYVNAFAARVFGSEPAGLVGKTLGELFLQPTAERLWHNLQAVFKSGSPRYVQNETTFPALTRDEDGGTKDDTLPPAARTVSLDTWLVPVKDEQGVVQSVFGVSRDVSDFVRAEAALRARELQLRFAVEQMPAVLWTTNFDLLVTWRVGSGGWQDSPPAPAGRNQESGIRDHARLLDVRPPSLTLEAFFAEPASPSSRPQARATGGVTPKSSGPKPEPSPSSPAVAAHRQALQGNSVRFEFVRGDRAWEARVEPLRNGVGAVVGTIGIASDVTNRKAVEAALRDREERFRNLFEYAPIGIYRSTPEGRILMANPALIRMLRYGSFYEISLRNLETEGFEPMSDRKIFKQEIERTGEVRAREGTWVRRDGAVLHVREYTRAVRDAGGRTLYYEGTVEDITDRRLAEERLFHLNAVLRAIRNVSELIIRQGNREELLTGVCENLVEVRGYRNAYIVLLRAPAAQSGAGDSVLGIGKTPDIQRPSPVIQPRFFSAAQTKPEAEFARLREKFAEGILPGPVQDALVTPDVVVTDPAPAEDASRTMSVRLDHEGKVHGALVVSMPPGFSAGSDEQTIFREMGAGIAYALHNIETEEERRRAQDALEASESRYRMLIEKVEDGVYTLDVAGRFTYVNDQILKRSGFTADRFIGHSFLEIVRHEDHAVVEEKFQAVLRGETPGPYELSYAAEGDTTISVEVNSAPLREGGRIVGLLGVSRDITARRRAETALRESEASFRTLVENASDGVLICDSTSAHLYANRQAARITGYTVDELLNVNLGGLAEPDELPKLRERLTWRLQGEPIPNQYETALRRKDGTRLEIEINTARTTWHGAPADLILIRDVHERKRAEQALQESEARYRSVVEASPDPIIIHRQGRIVFTNPAVAEFAGVPDAEQLLGKPVLDFVHPDSRAVVESRIRAMVEKREPAPLMLERFFRLDGTAREVEVAARPIVYDRLPAIITVFRDITDRRKAEIARRDSELRFRTVFEQSPVPMTFDRDGITLYANPATARLFGYADASSLAGRPITERIAPRERARVSKLTRQREMGESLPAQYETVACRQDGTCFPIQVVAARIELADGPATVGFLTDLTAHEQAQARLERLNRLYAVLSRINEAIVRIREPAALCREACRILVTDGGYRFTWVGIIDPDTGLINPIARAGHDQGYLDQFRISLDPDRGVLGFTGRAARENRPVIINDTETERGEGRGTRDETPDSSPLTAHPSPPDTPEYWRDLATHYGHRSLAAFPLATETITPPESRGTEIGDRPESRAPNPVVGTLTLYSDQPDCFDVEQVQLLEALAADLAFALQLAQLEQRQQADDRELRENEQRARIIFDQAPDPIAIISPDAHVTRTNPAFTTLLGWTPDTLRDIKITDLIESAAPTSRPSIASQFAGLLAGRTPAIRAQINWRCLGSPAAGGKRQADSGPRFSSITTATAVRDAEGKFVYAIVIIGKSH